MILYVGGLKVSYKTETVLKWEQKKTFFVTSGRNSTGYVI